MNTKSKRCVALINDIIKNTLDVRARMISNSLVLMLFILACINLIIPSEITADETDTAVFGLYKNGEKIYEFENDIDPAILSNSIDINQNLSPVARRYLEYVKKNDDYYQQPTFAFSRLVERCRNLVNKVHSDTPDLNSPEARELTAIVSEMKRVETELRESRLKGGMDSEQLIAMKEVNAKRAKLVELLESCQLSVEQKDSMMFRNSIANLIEHFDKMDAEREKYREAVPRSIPKPVIDQPRESLKVKRDRPKSVPKGSKNFKSEIPRDSSPFLKENIDVQFTDEIIALADELNNSPVEIYKYVRNNFDFDVYIGSRKGSQQTLDERAGNDYDLASLLIALLRVSGFSAGYVDVTAEIPADRFCNWMGIDDPVKAIDLLETEGFLVQWNGSIAAVNLVVVAALLPDVNYRGASNDSDPKNWILLDPTFKQYQYSSAINMLDELPNDFETDDFIELYYSIERPETPLEWFQQAMIDSLALYHPGADYDDLIRTRTVIEETDGILPGTLPYAVASYGSPYAVIPDNMRYKIQFLVTRENQYHVEEDCLDYTVSMPEIAGKQVTVSFAGFFQDDQETIDYYGGLYNVPPIEFRWLALVPVVNIDGCEVDRGWRYTILNTGFPSLVYVEFIPPDLAPTQHGVHIKTLTGDYVGIGLNTGGTAPILYNDPEYTCPEADEPYAGQVLHQTAMSYLNSSKDHDNEFRDLLHTKSSRDISVSFLFNDITAIVNYGYLDEYVWEGFIISSGGGSEYGVSTDLGSSDYMYEYNRLSGADGSIGENRVFENNFDAEAVSAIKILQLTDNNDICEVNNNMSECSPYDHDPRVVEIVNDFVDDGPQYKAYIPYSRAHYGVEQLWYGTGFILLDASTGAARYVLAGKMNGGGRLRDDEIYFTDGGGTVCSWDIVAWPDLFCTNVLGDITIDPPAPDDLYFAEREDYLTFTVPSINFYGRPDEYLVCRFLGTETELQFQVPYTIKEIAENPEFGPDVYTFVVGIRALNGLCGGSCQHEERSFTIFDVNIQDPHGNPEFDPGEAGANWSNERTFETGPAPYVEVFCEAEPDPDTPEVRALLEDNMIRWSVTEIIGSNLSWDSAWPNDPDKGEGIDPIATFSGMPSDYNEFGLKEVKLEIMDGELPLHEITTNIQVFFPRDEYNNPQGVAPNWYYYWEQVHPNNDATYDQNLSQDGKTPGMRDWRYHIPPDKNAIIIGPSASGEGRSYGFGRFFTGIDKFISVVIHEETHVDQIQRADPLVPSSGDDSFRYGWSWNADIYHQRHNHWSKGSDNEWGIAGIDDDHNQITDDAAPIPDPFWQFEPGYGRSPVEENLNHPDWADWPNVWPLPSPLYPVGPVESEAINASDNAMPYDHYHKSFDWGDPGKQHRTNEDYED